MHTIIKRNAFVAMLLLAASVTAQGAPVCVPHDPTTLRCQITQASDCDKINDYPYARGLYCPAAFASAQTMVSAVAKTLGVGKPTEGFFVYYQTLADPLSPPEDQAQTTVPCADTPAPYPGGSRDVVGAGTPLCHLVAYVTSPGPGDIDQHDDDNPIPDALRTFPDYFSKLYTPDKAFPLTKFRTGSLFDPIVIGLGAGAHDGFTTDYPDFKPTKLYLPDKWWKESRYHGISGGGGGGWGGEIAIVTRTGPLVQLAFGGGGGGGMTSFQPNATAVASSRLGAGGGGGVQFANGYRFKSKPYNGLGLGAGTGSDEAAVQYSYNDYDGSGRPLQPVHQYNAAVIADYTAQLKNLADQLKNKYDNNKAVVLRGGGGMGAGTEYLMANGHEFVPHALSTQAGFQFSYEFRKGRDAANNPGTQALDSLDAQQENIYAFIGDAYRIAARKSLEECDGDYSNFECMCPRQHAIVICLVGEKVGDPAKIPAWLQQRHCPDDAGLAGTAPNGFTRYQQFLIDASKEQPASCSGALRQYFTNLNTPINATE